MGSPRANWEYRMGLNLWGWFREYKQIVCYMFRFILRNLRLLSVPIGRSEGDGLTYPVNPRFDADGRWRRRKDWPPELR